MPFFSFCRWDFPVLCFDLTFLIWIYVALMQTMNDLRTSGQTVKLDVYTKLAYVMGAFVLLVGSRSTNRGRHSEIGMLEQLALVDLCRGVRLGEN